MTTICPGCRHVREADATVPAWQCPACGVAYVKAGGGSGYVRPAGQPSPASLRSQSAPALPWRKIAFVVAIIGGIAFGHQASRDRRSGDSGLIASLGAKLNASASDAEMGALAKALQPGDVTMYTTTDCPYCAQARSWLTSHAFAFTECDAEIDRRCADDLRSHGAKGVPFLIVKGRPMNDGFDSDEFVALLAKPKR